jgi:nucleoside-diphosphate-sugar epimerase
MKALITGAAGLVGSNLCRLWLELHGPHSVLALTGPVQHETEARRLAELSRWPLRQIPFDLTRRPVVGNGLGEFDVLFHLAAYVRTEDASPEVRINDVGTRWLLEELGEQLRGKHVVFASSIAAVDTTHARNEWMDTATTSCPRTDYGRTKLAAEAILKEESRRLGFTYCILRFPTVYGAGYRPGGMFGFFKEQLPGRTLGSRIPWPGRMSIVEVSDLAKILAESAVRDEMLGKTFFVSSGEDPTMGEMAGIAAECLGVAFRPLPIARQLFRPMGVIGSALAGAAFLPHPLRTLGWRVSLVVDGFCCDGSELTRLLGMSYSPWRESFQRMYR